MAKDYLTQDFLREVFTYDDATGSLIFKPKQGITQEERRWNTRYANKPCGSVNSAGYLHVKIRGKKEKVHRLIFLFHKGYLPKVVDHEDNDTLNNRIGNLREADTSKNNKNSRVRKSNSSGVKGVSWHKQHCKWYATIRSDNKVKFLGLFDDIEEAEKVVRKAREELHGDFCNHG